MGTFKLSVLLVCGLLAGCLEENLGNGDTKQGDPDVPVFKGYTFTVNNFNFDSHTLGNRTLRVGTQTEFGAIAGHLWGNVDFGTAFFVDVSEDYKVTLDVALLNDKLADKASELNIYAANDNLSISPADTQFARLSTVILDLDAMVGLYDAQNDVQFAIVYFDQAAHLFSTENNQSMVDVKVSGEGFYAVAAFETATGYVHKVFNPSQELYFVFDTEYRSRTNPKLKLLEEQLLLSQTR